MLNWPFNINNIPYLVKKQQPTFSGLYNVFLSFYRIPKYLSETSHNCENDTPSPSLPGSMSACLCWIAVDLSVRFPFCVFFTVCHMN